MFGYAAYKTKLGGVFGFDTIAQTYGTSNDVAATMSYDAGKQRALTGVATLETSLSKNIYNNVSYANPADFNDLKHKKLWPNTAAPDNHVKYSQWSNHNTQFASPGFLEAIP